MVDELNESFDLEYNYPFVGERRYFLDDDGVCREYEFTEEGQWIA